MELTNSAKKNTMINYYFSCNVRKCTLRQMHPENIQISLPMHAVSSLGTFWIAKDAKLLFFFMWTTDSYQTVQADLTI